MPNLQQQKKIFDESQERDNLSILFNIETTIIWTRRRLNIIIPDNIISKPFFIFMFPRMDFRHSKTQIPTDDKSGCKQTKPVSHKNIYYLITHTMKQLYTSRTYYIKLAADLILKSYQFSIHSIHTQVVSVLVHMIERCDLECQGYRSWEYGD